MTKKEKQKNISASNPDIRQELVCIKSYRRVVLNLFDKTITALDSVTLKH